jgi:hypothetical protein
MPQTPPRAGFRLPSLFKRGAGGALKIRWLTVGEILSVAAVILGVLGYLDAHREREAAHRSQEAEAAARAAKDTFLMTGTQADHGAALRLNPVHSEHVVQTQTVWFPKAVRAASVETTGNPRIEADWIADGVRKAGHDVKNGDSKSGKVPVVVQTVFIEDGDTKTDTAVYELAYSRHGRLLLGDRVDLEGLSLVSRKVGKDPQATADKWWGGK